MNKIHLQLKDANGNSYSALSMHYVSAMSGECVLQVELAFEPDQCLDKAQKLIGEQVCCQLFDNPKGSGDPLFSRSGLVLEITQTPNTDDRLQLTAVPFMTLLKYSNRYRIFQDKSIEDIVKAILSEDGFANGYKMGKMPSDKLPFCLQFDESDGDFIARLLAAQGIHYFIKQIKDKYEVHFHDAGLPFKQDEVIKLATDNAPDGEMARLSDWQQRLTFHAKQLQLGSWDETKAKWITSNKLNTKHSNAANKSLQHFHYPAAMIGQTVDASSSNAIAKKRLAQQESNFQLFSGVTDNYSIAVGQTVEVKEQGKFLVIAVRESFDVNAGEGGEYQCQFDCIEDGKSYFPPMLAKPQVNSVHSALVVGSDKAKPNHDDKGRVKVKFHWDTTDGDKTSCWLRVAQIMAGKSYGVQFLPREGQEVLVSFLGGDPDKPMITGCVYNDQQPLPDAKANSTVSTIKTQLDGKANEIAFDDKKDAEKLSLNAGRDFVLSVGKDAEQTVVGESKTKVSKKFTMVLEDEADIKVTKSSTTESKTYTVTAEDELKLVVGDNQLVINKNGIVIKGKKIDISADKALTSKGDSISIEATKGLNAKGKDIELKANGKLSQSSNMAMSLDSKNKISLSSLQDLGLTAKAGQLNAEGKLGTNVKGLKVDIAAQAMANVKAPLVKIN